MRQRGFRVAFAGLVLLSTAVLTASLTPPHSEAAASVSVSATSPTSVGSNATVTFVVQDDLGGGPNDVVLTGAGPGHFSSANSIGGACIPNPPSGTTTTSLSYSGACIDGLDPGSNSIDNLTTTATWLCTGVGIVTFNITQAAGTANAGTGSTTLQCGATSTSGTVTLVAHPNVLPCGGVTELTATLRDPVGNPITGVVFHFATDVGLLVPRTNNTALLQVAPPMTNATVVASVGGISGSVLVQVFCPTAPTPTANLTLATPTPAPASKMNLVASPAAIEECGGAVFLAATVTDAGGKPVPDGTEVLFLATGGKLSSSSANTVGGTATISYSADDSTKGNVSLRAQSGVAYASVTVAVKCDNPSTGEAKTSSRTSSTDSASDAFRSGDSSSRGSTSAGSTRGGTSGVIKPPSTGDGGIVSKWERDR